MPVSPAASTPAFSPVCPTCRYDLSATPDGRCPECGEAFTRTGLHERFLLSLDAHGSALNPARRRALASVAAAGIATWWAGLAVQVVDPELWMRCASPAFLTIAWIAAAAWRRRLDGLIAPPLITHYLWLVMLAWLTWAELTAVTGSLPASQRWGAFLAAPTFAAMYILLVRRRGVLWRVGVIVGFPPAVLGAIILASGLLGLAAGHHWSDWDDPRFAEPKALTTRQAATLGAALLAASSLGPLLCLAASRSSRGTPTPAERAQP